MDVIERWVVEIDYAARTLLLHAPGSYRCAVGCTPIRWLRAGGEWFVTARVMAAGRFRLGHRVRRGAPDECDDLRASVENPAIRC